MHWVEVALTFFMCHLVGDYLLQTDWQARHKHRGLSRDRVALRALVSHVVTYSFAYVPAVVWIGAEQGTGVALVAIAGISIPHLLQDDGRLIALYLARVKNCDAREAPFVAAAVDQTLHLVTLFGLALLVA